MAFLCFSVDCLEGEFVRGCIFVSLKLSPSQESCYEQTRDIQFLSRTERNRRKKTREYLHICLAQTKRFCSCLPSFALETASS
jgi:hypothetical protein